MEEIWNLDNIGDTPLFSAKTPKHLYDLYIWSALLQIMWYQLIFVFLFLVILSYNLLLLIVQKEEANIFMLAHTECNNKIFSFLQWFCVTN